MKVVENVLRNEGLIAGASPVGGSPSGGSPNTIYSGASPQGMNPTAGMAAGIAGGTADANLDDTLINVPRRSPGGTITGNGVIGAAAKSPADVPPTTIGFNPANKNTASEAKKPEERTDADYEAFWASLGSTPTGLGNAPGAAGTASGGVVTRDLKLGAKKSGGKASPTGSNGTNGMNEKL